jgi:phosphoribosyl 1,2-cyclic phosphodiesterase
VRITYFGVRGSCPCSSDRYRRYGGNTSCVLVEVEGDAPLVIDLGTGLRALGEYLHPTDLGAIGREPVVPGPVVPGPAAPRPTEPDATPPLRATALLTHLHYDHVLGLPFFTPMRDPGAVLDVYGPSQQGGPLRDVVAGIVQPPFFPIHMAEFRGQLHFHDLEGTEELTIGASMVTVRSIPHIGHTLGYRIEADGCTVVYVSDHQAPVDRRSVDENVLELCEGADLLIHDAQYTDEEFATLHDWGHSTAAYAVHVAREAGVGRLGLFHHDPAHGDDEIDQILALARRCGPPGDVLEIGAASEGSSVVLGRDPGKAGP